MFIFNDYKLFGMHALSIVWFCKHPYNMLNSKQKVKVSDTTGADSSNTAGEQNYLFQIAYSDRIF